MSLLGVEAVIARLGWEVSVLLLSPCAVSMCWSSLWGLDAEKPQAGQIDRVTSVSWGSCSSSCGAVADADGVFPSTSSCVSRELGSIESSVIFLCESSAKGDRQMIAYDH